MYYCALTISTSFCKKSLPFATVVSTTSISPHPLVCIQNQLSLLLRLQGEFWMQRDLRRVCSIRINTKPNSENSHGPHKDFTNFLLWYDIFSDKINEFGDKVIQLQLDNVGLYFVPPFYERINKENDFGWILAKVHKNVGIPFLFSVAVRKDKIDYRKNRLCIELTMSTITYAK